MFSPRSLSTVSGRGQPRPRAFHRSCGLVRLTRTLLFVSFLPLVVALDADTGAIKGEPLVAGSFQLKLVVADTLGWTDTIAVTLPVAAKLAIARRTLPAAKARRKFDARLTFSGGIVPRTWKVVHGSLPHGIRLNAKTGELAGAPRHAGTFPFTVRLSDRLGAVSARTFVLRVGR